MTQEEILDYNNRCAEFLGYVNTTPTDKDFNIYENKDGKMLETMSMLFHTDWNWIMEIVAKIQLLKTVHDNTRSYDSVFKEWQCTLSASYKTHDFGCIVGKSKTSEKEAVVQAINQFLIWYNEHKTI